MTILGVILFITHLDQQDFHVGRKRWTTLAGWAGKKLLSAIDKVLTRFGFIEVKGRRDFIAR